MEQDNTWKLWIGIGVFICLSLLGCGGCCYLAHKGEAEKIKAGLYITNSFNIIQEK